MFLLILSKIKNRDIIFIIPGFIATKSFFREKNKFYGHYQKNNKKRHITKNFNKDF